MVKCYGANPHLMKAATETLASCYDNLQQLRTCHYARIKHYKLAHFVPQVYKDNNEFIHCKQKRSTLQCINNAVRNKNKKSVSETAVS